MAGARAIKLQRDGEARVLRRGGTLHGFSQQITRLVLPSRDPTAGPPSH